MLRQLYPIYIPVILLLQVLPGVKCPVVWGNAWTSPGVATPLCTTKVVSTLQGVAIVKQNKVIVIVIVWSH